MNKILLINPVYNSGTIPKNIPLSKIASGLMLCNYEVDAIDFVNPDCENRDFSFFQKAEESFVNSILNKVCDYDIVYITTGTGSELKPYPLFPRVKTIAKAIKSNSNAKIYVGGALINLYVLIYKLKKEQICDGVIDKLIVGNEYNSFLSSVVKTHWPESTAPSWDIWKSNLYPTYKSVQYHVGCPFSCDFCFEGMIFDPRSDRTNLDDFISSIADDENIIIEDSVILSYHDFDAIIERLSSKKVRFAAYARISEIVNNPDKVIKMHSAGCNSMILGIETLNLDLLKEHNKEIVDSQTRLALDILKDIGVDIQGCFMLGFPKDTLRNMERTIEFAIKEQLKGYRWHIYQPNFSNDTSGLYINDGNSAINASDHLQVQLNVPDNCLSAVMETQPELGKLDEHFMFRSKPFINSKCFEHIGYRDGFSYQDIKDLIDKLFPQEWILNEEVLYKDLF